MYVFLTVALVLRATPSRYNLVFATATAATAIWSLTQCWTAGSWFASAAATIRDAAWITLLLLLIRSESLSDRLWARLASIAGLLLIADLFIGYAGSAGIDGTWPGGAAASRMTVSAFGLLLVENLLRNISRERFWTFKLLGIGSALAFGFNLVMEIPHLFMKLPDERFLAAQPLIYTMLAPLFLASAVRMPLVGLKVHSSRRVAFHSTTLLVAGVLAEGMAVAALTVRRFGGTEGMVLELVLLFTGAALALTAAASANLRSRIRVFINENFFSYKYDYRSEWSKFIQSLSIRDDEGAPMRVLRTLAELLDCPGGMLLARTGGNRHYLPLASWSATSGLQLVAADDPLLSPFAGSELEFLEIGKDAGTQDWRDKFPFAWLAVPLRYRGELAGLALLCPPRAPRKLDWEDRKLIALVAQQSALHLVQDDMTRTLADSRQLHDFNRRLAFAVHDLKNRIGQLNLIARNAERFWDDPRFRNDMVVTIRRSAEQLQELMARLRGDAEKATAPPQCVDLRVLLSDFVSSKTPLGATVRLREMPYAPMMAEVDRAALLNVLEHVVTNAIEAAPDSPVELSLHRAGDGYRICVEDRGGGMSPHFVAEELFRPLHSSKGEGLGIGAYQARQTMRDLKGDLEVSSTLGSGTTVQLVLPQAERAA